MIEALLAMPPHLRERLACALESGVLEGTPSLAALHSVIGNPPDAEAAARGLDELSQTGIGGAAAATWLRALNQNSFRGPQSDLVWSGPSVPGLHARDTRQVYEELLASAARTLWISTYVFFDGPRAFESLARKMAATPNFAVTLLLNIQRKWGDTTSTDVLVRTFADRFWNVEWPGNARPRVFYDPRALELKRPGGVLHAKAIVADEEDVFVTSANLTEAAFDRNIELGLLVRNSALARSVVVQFNALIDQRLLHALPLS